MRQRGDRRCLEPTSLDLVMQLIKKSYQANVIGGIDV